MKNNLVTLSLAITLAASSVSAATITFSNTNTAFDSLLAVVSSTDQVITNGNGSISVGYFTDDTAVSSGDFSSFVQFGSSTTFGAGNAFGVSSIYVGETSQDILAGSSFIDENIYTFVTFGGDALVAKSTLTFQQDNPTFVAGMDIANDGGISYLFGGTAGPLVDLGGGDVASIRLQAVPEPSAYAALAGLMALGYVMVRRRRA